MQAALQERFRSEFGSTNGMLVGMAPGRVNLLGEYTDLNEGYVLPMTVDRCVYVALRKRRDSTVRLYSARYDELIEYGLRNHPKPRAGSWSSYVCGVVEELRLLGLLKHGFEGVVDGDLPLGSGLSSSAALEIATAISLQQQVGFPLDPVEMIRLCRHVEHRYANVQCGIMDQFASRLGRENHALFLDCRSLNYEHIPLRLGDYRVVIISTGIERSLAGSAYNVRRDECEQACEFFRLIDSNIVALRDVSTEMFAAHCERLPDNVRRRCRHVIAENQRVLDAITLLSNGELDQFGALMNASNDSLRDDFEVSCTELDFLNTLARNADGVLGARMTGAGFGGCTVNLVHREAVSTLEDQVKTDYTSRFDFTPTVFVLQDNMEAGPLHVA
jgi:galactokinase